MTASIAWQLTKHDNLRNMTAYTTWQLTQHDRIRNVTAYRTWQLTQRDNLHDIIRNLTILQVRSRQDLGKTGVEDMIQISDLNEASLLWNLRLRY